MLKSKLLCLSLLMILYSGFAAAQGISVSGTVTDAAGEPLIAASVQLKNAGDTVVAGTLTDVSGQFTLSRISAGNYLLEIAYLGYQPKIQPITIRAEPVVLGTIRLTASQTTSLAEVKVVAQAIAVRQKSDTTEYNAGSYKVNPNADAADLIRKMPGMDLSSGTPKTQGEAIVKVLVDGKPFFGADPATALNNLPAEVIDKIQVYDEQSEQSKFTGFDDGNTSKTINIVTKPEKRLGIFGQVHAGYWPDDKYNVGGNVNYFSGARRISLIGLSNNVNIQNFGEQDLIGVGGSQRRRHHRRDNNFMVDPSEGIARTHAVGINYSDQWGEKIEVTGSYFFNNRHNTANQETHRTYISSGQQGQTYDETTHSVSDNYNHRFNLRMDYTIDSNNSILFIPSLSIQSNDRYSDLTGSSLREGGEVLNQTLNHQQWDQLAYDFSSRLLIRHRFRKPGRTLSFWGRGGWSQNSGNSLLKAVNTYEDTTQNGRVDQKTDRFENEWDLDANITYTEPLSEKSGLQLRYRLSYDAGRSGQRAYDLLQQTGGQPVPDSLLSNVFNSQYITHRPGLGYRYSDQKLRLGLRLYYQYATLHNEGVLPYSFTQKKYFDNVLPSAWLRYQFDKNKSLRLYYRSGTDNPSVKDLQEVVDNRNPLQLSSGNPALDQALEHRLRLRYSGTNPEASTTFFTMLGIESTQGYIGRNTLIADRDQYLSNGIFLPEGAQYTHPENMNGYWEIENYTTYGMPLALVSSNLNLHARASYERTPGVINGNKNFANNYNTGLGFTLSSNISEKVDFTLASTGSYNWVKNTLNKTADNSFYNQTSRLSVNLIFWKEFVWHTELNHQLYTGLDQSFNQNFLLWNMSIGKKLFKSQRGTVKLSVFDLLNQNNDLQRTVTALYTEDIQTNVLQRYFLLTFVYNLRFFQGGASMKDIENK